MKTLEEAPLTDRERGILRKIRDAARSAAPDATVIFFGSRARGEAREHSDWDVLVLTERVTPEIKDDVYDALYEIELEQDIIIGPLILSKGEWDGDRFKDHPIHGRVDEEGVLT